MNDLSHFVPLTETVTIRDQEFNLVGVDIQDLGQLLYRFPEIIDVFTKQKAKAGDDASNSPPAAGLALSKEVMSAFVAVGIGKAGDAAAEKSIASLSLGERLAMFNAVFRITSPGGIGPFVELVTALGGGVVPTEAVAEPDKRKTGARMRFKPSSTPPTI